MLYPEIRKACKEAGHKDPLPAFLSHRGKAADRGVPFTLTFEQWWSLWEPHWPNRGLGALQMCMCRKADQGGYELGNVRIATNKENHHERNLEWKTKRMQRPYRFREYRTTLNAELVDWAGGRNRSKKPYTEEDEAA
jgi:hypothetical protein